MSVPQRSTTGVHGSRPCDSDRASRRHAARLRASREGTVGALVPQLPDATAPSSRWSRFKAVVRKVSRVIFYLADILLVFRTGRAGLVPAGIEGPS